MTDDAGFMCLVPFTDQSASFVHGFEAGQIWQRMAANERKIGGEDDMPTHIQNRETFQRMADAQAYDLCVSCIDDVWMIATFTKRESRFRIVDRGQP